MSARTASSEQCKCEFGGNVQLEERVGNLQHQNVWVVVFVADQDTLAGSAHAMFHVVLFQSLQACKHRRILFWLVLFGTEGVVAEREEADGGRLVCIEWFRNDGPFCIVLLSEDFAEAKEDRFRLTGMMSAAHSLLL